MSGRTPAGPTRRRRRRRPSANSVSRVERLHLKSELQLPTSMASSRRDDDDLPADSVEPSTPANSDPANTDRYEDGFQVLSLKLIGTFVCHHREVSFVQIWYPCAFFRQMKTNCLLMLAANRACMGNSFGQWLYQLPLQIKTRWQISARFDNSGVPRLCLSLLTPVPTQ